MTSDEPIDNEPILSEETRHRLAMLEAARPGSDLSLGASLALSLHDLAMELQAELRSAKDEFVYLQRYPHTDYRDSLRCGRRIQAIEAVLKKYTD